MIARTEANITMIILRWTARVGSLLSIGLILSLFIGAGFRPAQVTPTQWVGLVFFPAGVIAGMIIAWWKEAVGASITLANLLAFYGVYGLLFGNQIRGWAFIAFAAPGFLFLLHWILSRNKFAGATS